MSKKISVRIDPDRYDLLCAFSEREGFNVSTILRHPVYRFLEQEQRFQQPMSRHEKIS